MPKQKTKRAPGQPISLRLSPESRRQLDELMERWGDSQTDAIKRAIERAHTQTIRTAEAKSI